MYFTLDRAPHVHKRKNKNNITFTDDSIIYIFRQHCTTIVKRTNNQLDSDMMYDKSQLERVNS